MKRRVVTFLAVAVATAAGSLWWLHDADDTLEVSSLTGAAPDALVGAAKAAWNADDLARKAVKVADGLTVFGRASPNLATESFDGVHGWSAQSGWNDRLTPGSWVTLRPGKRHKTQSHKGGVGH